MKISITGASGHIGANLCRALHDQGHQLRLLINRSAESLKGLPYEAVHGSILSEDILSELVRHTDVIIHLAAFISIKGSRKKDIKRINVSGTENLIKACKKHPSARLVHFSSIHALHQTPYDRVLDETRPLALNDPVTYNQTKALAEQRILEAVATGLDAVILNPTAVIGPHDYRPSLLGQAIIRIYRGSLPALVPGGYDWVDVRDVVSGTLAAMTHGRAGERYLLPGHWRDLKQLASVINSITQPGRTPPMIPFWIAHLGSPFLRVHAKLKNREPLYTAESLKILRESHTMISFNKAAAELGYAPRPFEITIKDTLEWFQTHGYAE